MYWLFEVLERTFTPEKYKKRTDAQRKKAERIYQEFFQRQLVASRILQANIRTSKLLADVLLETKRDR